MVMLCIRSAAIVLFFLNLYLSFCFCADTVSCFGIVSRLDATTDNHNQEGLQTDYIYTIKPNYSMLWLE